MGWKINGNEEGFIERSPGQIPVMVKVRDRDMLNHHSFALK